MSIDEKLFVECLRAGVERTKGLLARLTDYHGGPALTEYLLTADIAREFIERDYKVVVECLNRFLVNAVTATDVIKARKLLKSKRTDVALICGDLVPISIIELKIGVSSLRKIQHDISKISTTISLLSPRFASDTIGAVVFQVHVGGGRRRTHAHEFERAVLAIEKRIEDSLRSYQMNNTELSYKMVSLQGDRDGIVGSVLEPDGDSFAWGEDGHATRYHAIIIRKLSSPQVGTSFADLKAQADRT